MWRRPNLKGKLAMHGVTAISLLMMDIFRFRMSPNECLWQRQTEHASFLQRFINRCTIVATIQGKWRPCGETDDSEYKSEVNRGFLKTVSAFANFNGGRIVFGVSALTDDVMRTLGLLNGDTPTNAAAMLADEIVFPGVDLARFGTGVRRIRSAYEGTGSSPSFEAGDGYVSVRLPFVDRRCALTDEERSVLDAVPENRLVSRSTVSEVTGYEKTKTVRRLNSLVAKGYLRQEGEGRGRRYACAD